MQALEVGDLGLVSRLDQRLETGHDEFGSAAAQDGLFAEEIGLGFFAEGRLDDSAAGAADALGIGQADIPGAARVVLVDRQQARHAAAFLEDPAHEVARPLGRDHEDVHVFGRDDLVEMDVEPVGEGQGVALRQVRRNEVIEKTGLKLVVDQHHDDVGLGGRLLHGTGLESVLYGLVPRAALPQSHDDVQSGIAQGKGVGVSLAAVTDNRDGLAVQYAQIGVLIVIQSSHWFSFMPFRRSGRSGGDLVACRTCSHAWSGQVGGDLLAFPLPDGLRGFR